MPPPLIIVPGCQTAAKLGRKPGESPAGLVSNWGLLTQQRAAERKCRAAFPARKATRFLEKKRGWSQPRRIEFHHPAWDLPPWSELWAKLERETHMIQYVQKTGYDHRTHGICDDTNGGILMPKLEKIPALKQCSHKYHVTNKWLIAKKKGSNMYMSKIEACHIKVFSQMPLNSGGLPGFPKWSWWPESVDQYKVHGQEPVARRALALGTWGPMKIVGLLDQISLVGSWPTPLKNITVVSWDDYFQYIYILI